MTINTNTIGATDNAISSSQIKWLISGRTIQVIISEESLITFVITIITLY